METFTQAKQAQIGNYRAADRSHVGFQQRNKTLRRDRVFPDPPPKRRSVFLCPECQTQRSQEPEQESKVSTYTPPIPGILRKTTARVEPEAVNSLYYSPDLIT